MFEEVKCIGAPSAVRLATTAVLRVHVWDLGWQEEYMATHLLFFDDQAGFVLVVNIRIWACDKTVKVSNRYVPNICIRAPKSPLRLVGTYIDELEDPKAG